MSRVIAGNRLAELDAEIEAYRSRLGAMEQEGGPGFAERHAAVTFSKEMVERRRANIAAGLAEDFGIVSHTDLKAMEAKFAKRFADLELRLVTELAAFKSTTAKGIVKAIVAEVAPRIKAMEAQLAGSDSDAMRYRGVYQRSLAYAKGATVTERGGLWIATRAVEAGEIPGDGDGWQLAIKRERAPRNRSTPDA